MIKSNDIKTQFSLYACAGCGNDVYIRKDRMVECKNCDHKTVMKKRILNPVQYVAI